MLSRYAYKQEIAYSQPFFFSLFFTLQIASLISPINKQFCCYIAEIFQNKIEQIRY